MEEQTPDVIEESSPQQENVSEDVTTPPEAPVKTEEKVVPYQRFKEVNDELARLKKAPPKSVNKALDVEDYIDISASLEGLDQREKEYLAQQHKLTGKALKEIRQDEDFTLWQTAYRAKVEKAKSLAPSSTQGETEKPKTLTSRLAGASMEEKEKILSEMGLWKNPKQNLDRRNIGLGR